ncbi:MAG: hypothetical protein E7580_01455 [Ruminococcaceae bacterium]|nr:hypothetical protein [Oscillospiraceae bacterium]
MKKPITLFCLIALLFPLCACGATLEPPAPVSEEKATEQAAPIKKPSSDDEEEKIEYPKDCFSVGYSIADISMTPLPIYEGTAESIHDPIQLTCTAVCDGENVALLMSADLKGINVKLANSSRELLEKEFEIPYENIIINTTHTHNAHTAGGNSADETRWTKLWYEQLKFVAEDALRDLAPAEAYAGVSHTSGLTFVRRYRLKDGTYKTNAGATSGVVAHESVADNELRTLRFVREGKRDVLMVNYQTHYGGATGMYKNQLSADFITPFRDTAEKELGCYFVYHSGASGNLNFNSPIPGEKKYPDFIKAIDGFMIATRDALSKEKKINTGKIVAAEDKYVATVLHDSEQRVKQAKEVQAAGSESPHGQALIQKYGFESKREVNAIVTRDRLSETNDIYLSCITFGDIAFTAFPYEMFDKNGKDCREASPYKMTFICSLTNGGHGYIPTTEAFPHGGYEVYVTRYVQGTGEALVNTMLTLLNDCKNKA